MRPKSFAMTGCAFRSAPRGKIIILTCFRFKANRELSFVLPRYPTNNALTKKSVFPRGKLNKYDWNFLGIQSFHITNFGVIVNDYALMPRTGSSQTCSHIYLRYPSKCLTFCFCIDPSLITDVWRMRLPLRSGREGRYPHNLSLLT